MKCKRILPYIFTILVLFSSSCESSLDDIPITISIPSLRENYPLMFNEAQKWQANVYLNEATIILHPDMRVAISAEFYSPTQNRKTIGVNLMRDGSITSEVFLHKYPIYHHKPIYLDDWDIDSQEAIEYILDSDIRREINSDAFHCSFIRLERFLPLEDQPVVWILQSWDCSNTSQTTYIDPKTGDTMNLSRDIVPTRFPTKTSHD